VKVCIFVLCSGIQLKSFQLHVLARFTVGQRVHCIRKGTKVGEGKIRSIRRFKEEVRVPWMRNLSKLDVFFDFEGALDSGSQLLDASGWYN
jgi:hypothetical protein